MNIFSLIISIIIVIIIIFLLKNKIKESFKIGRKYDKTLLFYHMPWCGYCKNFMPVWDMLKPYKEYYNVDMQAINCERYPEICTRDNVQSYPTIRLVSGNKKIENDGNRTLEDLLNFIKY